MALPMVRAGFSALLNSLMSEPNRPTPQPGILDIAAYRAGKSAGKGETAVKLSANESPLGASPRAVDAFAKAAQHLAIYPEGSSQHLREALGEVYGIDPNSIVCGNGSGDILYLLAQCYLGEGTEAIMSEYAFSLYPIATRFTGASLVTTKAGDYVTDVDAILAAVTERTRIIWLDNPNNPTGTYLSSDEVRRLHAGLRPDILLVIDNAYAEYVIADDFEVGLDLARTNDNVVMVRTFSKMGLAAARVGWMVGPDHVVDAVHRIRGPFNVNLPAQMAAAAAARDIEFNARLNVHNATWRDWLQSEVTGNHIRVLPSQANFVLVLFDTPAHAASAFRALMAAGYIVREVGHSYGIDNGLRISIGTEAAMRGVAKVLTSMDQTQ